MDIATQTHLTTLRGLLAFRLRELQADVRAAGMSSHEQEIAGEVTDRKDDAAQSMMTGVSAAEDRLHRVELAEVEHALHRLDTGTYGDCIDCGAPIPLPRLLIMPAATRCAECQASCERSTP